MKDYANMHWPALQWNGQALFWGLVKGNTESSIIATFRALAVV